MKNRLLLIVLALFLVQVQGNAQKQDSLENRVKSLEKLKVSGYIQGQTEIGQIGARARTGTNGGRYDEAIDGKNSELFTRYGLRRSRIKFQYSESFIKGVFQLDISEKGVFAKEAYIQLDDPYLNIFTLKTGIVYVSFSDEVNYSSSRREAPEHTLLTNKLIPDEKDLGTQLRITAPKNSVLNGLTLDLGIYSGNGIRIDDNSNMDFASRIKYNKSISNMNFGIGASFYNGLTNNADSNLYRVENGIWTRKEVERNKKNKRQYFGFDAQFGIKTFMGWTRLRGEYLFGKQPSIENDLSSPKSNSYIASQAFSYQRSFSGGYLYFIQDVYKTPLTFVFKYSYIDPNIDMGKNQVNNKADLSFSTFGFGAYWTINPALRLTAFYDINTNERTNFINGYDKDIKDNLFTLRLQYKF